MEQDTEVVPRSQGSPSFHHQRKTVTDLKPEGGSLQEAPTRGRTNPNTGTSGNYCGQASGGRGDFICSAKTTGGAGGRTIRHEVRTPEEIYKGGNQVERPRH